MEQEGHIPKEVQPSEEDDIVEIDQEKIEQIKAAKNEGAKITASISALDGRFGFQIFADYPGKPRRSFSLIMIQDIDPSITIGQISEKNKERILTLLEEFDVDAWYGKTPDFLSGSDEPDEF